MSYKPRLDANMRIKANNDYGLLGLVRRLKSIQPMICFVTALYSVLYRQQLHDAFRVNFKICSLRAQDEICACRGLALRVLALHYAGYIMVCYLVTYRGMLTL